MTFSLSGGRGGAQAPHQAQLPQVRDNISFPFPCCRGEFHKKIHFYIFTFLHLKATFPYVIQGQFTQNLHNYTYVKM